MTIMHAPAPNPKPDTKEKTFAILTLDGKEVDTAPTRWIGLMRGYLKLGCGNFSVEEKR
jgi:hypothetical protein